MECRRYRVGPVTAAPLQRLGVPAVYPQRYRLGALARLITDEFAAPRGGVHRGWRKDQVRSGVELVVDGEIRAVPPAAMSLLRRLMACPGLVVSREDLLMQLPGGGGDGTPSKRGSRG